MSWPPFFPSSLSPVKPLAFNDNHCIHAFILYIWSLSRWNRVVCGGAFFRVFLSRRKKIVELEQIVNRACRTVGPQHRSIRPNSGEDCSRQRRPCTSLSGWKSNKKCIHSAKPELSYKKYCSCVLIWISSLAMLLHFPASPLLRSGKTGSSIKTIHFLGLFPNNVVCI